ncbi:MAG: hypothetical protein WA857_04875 [Candidatus Acidiferrum sp.]
MLGLKYLLMILGLGLFGSASALVAYDVYLSEQLRRVLTRRMTSRDGAKAEGNRAHGAIRLQITSRQLDTMQVGLPQRAGKEAVALSSGRA